MPVALSVPRRTLAGETSSRGCASPRRAARALLRWLLLDADAAHVCRRRRQSGLDAGARRDYGRGTIISLGPTTHDTARARVDPGRAGPGLPDATCDRVLRRVLKSPRHRTSASPDRKSVV